MRGCKLQGSGLRRVSMATRSRCLFGLSRLDEIGTGHEPGNVGNFILTASYGGTHDSIIKEYGLRYARVVFTTDEAHALGLSIDHDDSHAMRHGQDFVSYSYTARNLPEVRPQKPCQACGSKASSATAIVQMPFASSSPGGR